MYKIIYMFRRDVNYFCVLHLDKTRRWFNVDLMLAHRLRRWNINNPIGRFLILASRTLFNATC